MPGQPTSVGSKIGLDAKTGRATQTARTTYVALLTSAPSDTTTLATMAEVSAAGYARQTYGPTDPGSTESTANTAQLTFGPFTADPANVTHLALVSASSGTTGDLIFYWTADAAKDAAIGDSITIAAGALTITEE